MVSHLRELSLGVSFSICFQMDLLPGLLWVVSMVMMMSFFPICSTQPLTLTRYVSHLAEKRTTDNDDQPDMQKRSLLSVTGDLQHLHDTLFKQQQKTNPLHRLGKRGSSSLLSMTHDRQLLHNILYGAEPPRGAATNPLTILQSHGKRPSITSPNEIMEKLTSSVMS